MRLRSRAVGPEPSAEASAPSRTHDTPDGAELLAFGATCEATPEDGVATMGALGTIPRRPPTSIRMTWAFLCGICDVRARCAVRFRLRTQSLLRVTQQRLPVQRFLRLETVLAARPWPPRTFRMSHSRPRIVPGRIARRRSRFLRAGRQLLLTRSNVQLMVDGSRSPRLSNCT